MKKSTAKIIRTFIQDIPGFKVGLHIIFYRKLKGNKIEIARILNGRMDLKIACKNKTTATCPVMAVFSPF
ncbi:MAG: type II toxin-antitoxin system RelE/ParE family toxin [Bacteroidia bacterium]|nr:type II toxin-antitoxin system RelE/ParE family toxin [Bacteroidia bacterium]